MSKLVERHDRSPAFKLFNFYVDVGIPYYYSEREREQEFGRVRYHNRMAEREDRNSMVAKRHTSVELAIIASKNVPILYYHPEDPVLIRRWLIQHLEQKAAQYNDPFHVGKVPMSDLVIMQEYAEKLTPLAGVTDTPKEVLPPNIQELTELFGTSILGDLAKPEVEVTDTLTGGPAEDRSKLDITTRIAESIANHKKEYY